MKVFYGLICFVLMMMSVMVFAQTPEWKTDQLEGGQYTVKYAVSEITNDEGRIVPHVLFDAKGQCHVSLNQCVQIMKNVSNHQKFTGDKVSKVVTTVSDHEWVVYYYTPGVGPIPDGDMVARMVYTENTNAKTAQFQFTAAPDLLEVTPAARIKLYRHIYLFKDLGNGLVELNSIAEMSPAFAVPLWMVRLGFPGAPAEAIKLIFKNITEL